MLRLLIIVVIAAVLVGSSQSASAAEPDLQKVLSGLDPGLYFYYSAGEKKTVFRDDPKDPLCDPFSFKEKPLPSEYIPLVEPSEASPVAPDPTPTKNTDILKPGSWLINKMYTGGKAAKDATVSGARSTFDGAAKAGRNLKQGAKAIGSDVADMSGKVLTPQNVVLGTGLGMGIWALSDKDMFLRKWLSGPGSSGGSSAQASPGGDVWVRPTVTKNGVYRSGHWQTRPDGSLLNNYSTKGNYNPYTGKWGTKNVGGITSLWPPSGGALSGPSTYTRQSGPFGGSSLPGLSPFAMGPSGYSKPPLYTSPSRGYFRSSTERLSIRFISEDGYYIQLDDRSWWKSYDHLENKYWNRGDDVILADGSKLINLSESSESVDVTRESELTGFDVEDSDESISSDDNDIVTLLNGKVFKVSGFTSYGDVDVLTDGFSYKLIDEDDIIDAERLR